MGFKFFFFIISLCVFSDLSAQVIVHESVQDSIVVSEISCFIDHTGDLTLDEVLQHSFDNSLEEAGEYIAKQNTRRQFWFKLNVKAIDSITAPIAVSFYAYSSVTVFVRGDGEPIREKKVGSEDIGNYYFEDYNQRVVPVLVSRDYSELIVAVRNKSKVYASNSFTARFATQKYFDEVKMKYRPSKGGEGYLFLLFCGVLIFQCLYVLIQWYLVRKRVYFYYVLYIFSVFFYYYLRFSAFYSENRAWALLDAADMHNFNHILLIVPSILYLLFASAFVDLRTRDRKLYRVLNVLIAILTLCVVAQFLLLSFPNDFDKLTPVTIALIVQVPVNIYALVRIARQRRRIAWFLVVGSAIAFLSHLLANTLPLVFPISELILTPLEITMVGVTLEVIIFNSGLLFKAKEADLDRIEAQNSYIRELKSRQIIQSEYAEVRDKISSDLHDDVGSSLSSIGIYSYAAKENLNAGKPEQAAELLQNIQRNAEATLNAMSDLVWATNPRNDSNEKLIERIRSFGYEILSARECLFKVVVDERFYQIVLNQAQRKNLLLILKEAINNAAKYSKASTVVLKIEVRDGAYIIRLKDNGVGFKPDLETSGNGMNTMRKRSADLGGLFELRSGRSGTEIIVDIKS
ncbi:MAG: 7TM diverse intracellular signaling domain-containing protein [Cryomorphaceae bacterium]